jgi:hypothetical protein
MIGVACGDGGMGGPSGRSVQHRCLCRPAQLAENLTMALPHRQA